MSVSISNSFLHLSPLLEGGYQLTVSFSDSEKTVSSTSFIFSSLNPNSLEGRIWDVYSQNTTCEKVRDSQFFTSQDVKEIKNAFIEVGSKSGPKLFVLDIKAGGENPYLSEEITTQEKVFCEFFEQLDTKELFRSLKGKPTAISQAVSVFTSQGSPDFIFCEGSLKKDLLEKGGFSKEQQQFFQKRGAMQFCQLAEIFINSFKFGQTAMSCNSTAINRFSLASYLVKVSRKFADLPPCKVSCVLYPPLYRNLYAVEGPFFQALQAVFSVSGAFNLETGITTVCVGEVL